MIQCTAKELIQATGGTLLWGDPEQEFGSISTDSRSLEPGDVFWAIQGDRYDGHSYVYDALGRAAAGVVVTEDLDSCPRPDGSFCVQIPDTIRALGDFASYIRQKINPRVVTISGSCGKTTTKDMCVSVLQGPFNVLATEGNKNNLIGLPQTLFRLSRKYTLAVVELGMNHTGELLRLTEIAQPGIAIMTNIHEAHIGMFGSLDDLIAAKCEVIQAMPENSVLIANADCANTFKGIERVGRKVQIMTFGVNSPADVMAEETEPLDPMGYRIHVRSRGKSAWIELRFFGRFQIYNALAALTAGVAMGVDLECAAERLNVFRPAALRAEVETFRGVRLIKDCYNAAPSATLQALASLKDLTRSGPGGRMVALLGDMMELGEFEERYHRAVGEKAAELSLDLVVTVGRRARTIYDVLNRSGLACRHCEDSFEAGRFLAENLRPNDTVLIKGARLMRLEGAIESLKQAWETSTPPISIA